MPEGKGYSVKYYEPGTPKIGGQEHDHDPMEAAAPDCGCVEADAPVLAHKPVGNVRLPRGGRGKAGPGIDLSKGY